MREKIHKYGNWDKPRNKSTTRKRTTTKSATRKRGYYEKGKGARKRSSERGEREKGAGRFPKKLYTLSKSHFIKLLKVHIIARNL